MDSLLLLSAGAGAGTGAADSDALAAAVQVLAEAGSVQVARTSTPAEIDATLSDLGERLLVVGGGDGTLQQVVRRLWRRTKLSADAPLGLIPLGTGNDFARHLDLPLDPVAAAKVVVTGSARRLDLLRDDHGNVVVNAVHLGIGADAALRATGLKARFGRLAYPLGAVLTAVRPRGWRMRVEVDDELLADGERVAMVVIGNGSSIGGGHVALPDARADDGALDVALGPDRRRLISRARGRAVSVFLEPGAEIGVNADGEIATMRRQRSWWVERDAWSVLR